MAYNGWTNYETWNVALWMDNEEPLYRARKRLPKPSSRREVEELVRELMPTGTPDFKGPEAYEKVDWDEIKEAWHDE